MREIQLDKRFQDRLKGVFEKYSLEVGILEDKPYRKPMRGERGKKGQDVLTNFAGKTVRKASRVNSGQNVSDVSKANRERYDYLKKPFRQQGTALARLIKDFFDLAFGRSEKKRLENTLQAIVRNPILSKKYGENSDLTKRIKGFSHAALDTGQLFKSIRARVKVRA